VDNEQTGVGTVMVFSCINSVKSNCYRSSNTHKLLVTLTLRLKRFFISLLYSIMTIFYKQITYCHYHDVGQLSSTKVSCQDSQQQRTQSLTKFSQHENSTLHTSIRIVSWVIKCYCCSYGIW